MADSIKAILKVDIVVRILVQTELAAGESMPAAEDFREVARRVADNLQLLDAAMGDTIQFEWKNRKYRVKIDE